MVLSAAATACAGQGDDRRTVVASFYPLAFVAQRVAGSGWDVVDLTPPGTEAHDVELAIEDRAAIEDAEVVLYLGDFGFQPQVEAAVREASGTVVAVGEASGEDVEADPHLWLDPTHMARMAEVSTAAIPGASDRGLRSDLEALTERYSDGLASCRYRTLVVSHEAFGYLADAYGLEQFGLAGVDPEGEPGAARLAEAHELLSSGRAGAVFFEPSGEGREIAETVAADAGVPALPLSTLESQPANGDYLSVMDDNLASLRRGLECE